MELLFCFLLLLSWSTYAGLWVDMSECGVGRWAPDAVAARRRPGRRPSCVAVIRDRIRAMPAGVILPCFIAFWLPAYGLALWAVLHFSFDRILSGAW